MRTFFKVACLAVLLAPAAAHAAANCWTISDPNERALCRAVQSKSVGDCTTISNYDDRQACRARVGGNESNCNSLSTQWKRDECRKGAEKKQRH